MSEMIERLARAIAQEFARQDDHDEEVVFDAGHLTMQYIDQNYVDFGLVARAAIEAMRDPTEVMVTAGADADIPGGQYGEPTFRESRVDEDDVHVVWRTMIDAVMVSSPSAEASPAETPVDATFGLSDGNISPADMYLRMVETGGWFHFHEHTNVSSLFALRKAGLAEYDPKWNNRHDGMVTSLRARAVVPMLTDKFVDDVFDGLIGHLDRVILEETATEEIQRTIIRPALATALAAPWLKILK